MAIEAMVESLGLAAILTLAWWDVVKVEAADALRRRTARAWPQPSDRERCPFCHGVFNEDQGPRAQVRCARCGTEHHGECWRFHGSCSVFGCGESEVRPVVGGGPEAEGPEAESPGAESPGAESPGAESPEAESREPESREPESREPESRETESPEAGSPVAGSPETESPEAESPEAESPGTESPGTESPVAGGFSGYAPGGDRGRGIQVGTLRVGWTPARAGSPVARG